MADRDTLVYNPEKLDALRDTILQRKKEFDDAITAMFQVIDVDMNNVDHWTGEAFDEFKSKCDNFRKGSIETMSGNLNSYSKHFGTTSEKAVETTNANVNRVKDETEIKKYTV